LREELKRALRRAEIGEAEADIRRDDADEGHSREVVAFRDHLCADEDVDLTVAKLPQNRRQRALAADGVAIEPGHSRARTEPLHFGFYAFGPVSGLLEIRARAFRTRRRHAHRVVAVVAARSARRPLAVHDK